METCEKLFRDTRLRTSSENIGLARHPEGLELVRIGKPLRPEFAAWRYGDQLGDRRRRQIVGLAVGTPVGVASFASYQLVAWLTMVPGVVLIGAGVYCWIVYLSVRRTVGTAVAEIESHGHPGRFLARVAHEEHTARQGRVGYVKGMPKPTRLALEMALHEEQERRALEGELWLLEQAWKEAEEIAAISDDLLLPARTEAFFERHGERGELAGTRPTELANGELPPVYPIKSILRFRPRTFAAFSDRDTADDLIS